MNLDNRRVHLLKSGMIVDKIIIAILVVCMLTVIVYLVFANKHTCEDEKIDITTTYVPIITTNKKKYIY